MEQTCGWLRWTPEAYWNSTLSEVTAAIMGFLELRGERPNVKAQTYDALLDMVRDAQRAEARERRANERKQHV